MNIFQAVILGAVQGVTEFLPISSSGHLIIVPHLLGWAESPLVFDTTLHLGTAAALIAFFFKDLWKIGLGFIRDVWAHEDEVAKFSKEGRMGLYILLGSIPAGAIGYLFQDKIEEVFRSVNFVVVFLILGSVLMFAAEKVGNWKKRREAGYLESFVVGLFQALALLPGVSRSGATISGGMLFGMARHEAARFSFLLSIPIVVLAGGYELYKGFGLVAQLTPQVFLAGFLSSFVVGLLAIRFLLKYLQSNSLLVFVWYRVLVAAAILITLR